jgi:hypothetical protein
MEPDLDPRDDAPEAEEHDDHDAWIDARREDRDDYGARW